MAINDKNELRSLLWNLINPLTNQTNQTNQANQTSVALPAYATNKITQLFVLTWKRGYATETLEAKQNLFFQLKSLLDTASNQQAVGAGGGTAKNNLLSFSLRLTRYVCICVYVYMKYCCWSVVYIQNYKCISIYIYISTLTLYLLHPLSHYTQTIHILYTYTHM